MLYLDNSTTCAPSGNYKIATDYGYVYVQTVTYGNGNNDTTDTTNTSFQRNQQTIYLTNVGPRCDAGHFGVEGDTEEVKVIPPTRVVRLKLCPCRTRPLSNPMALCYWAQAPPAFFIVTNKPNPGE